MSPDPYRYFRIESRELIDQLTQAALDLERALQPAVLIDTMLRLTHTLKGAARVVKQHGTAEHAHAIEDLLVPLRGSTQAIGKPDLAALFASLDAIRKRVTDLESPVAHVPSDDVMPAVAEKTLPAPHDSYAGAADLLSRIDAEELDRLREHLSDTHIAAEAMDRQQAALDQARQLASRVGDAIRRLELNDQDLLGAVDSLSSLLAGSHRAIDGVAPKLRADLDAAREAAAHLQFVSADSLFVSLEMAARDAANLAGKEVRVTCEGGSIRLASDVVSVAQAALIQAVRNAVAHGLESVEERLVCGKEPRGRIKIAVRRDGAKIAFCCTDDGAGVNLAELRGALAIPEDDGKIVGKEELLRRLLQGSISTSKDVTQLSGRGVGLGILREAAARLRGELALRSEPGAGTEIELRVPLSSAMLDALIVGQAGHFMAIPLHTVKQTLRVSTTDLVVEGRGQSLVIDGKVVPYASMGQALRQTTVDLTRHKAWSAVIIEATTGMAAIGVEQIQGIQNIVVKALPRYVPADDVIAAAYLDPAGRPQLVINPERLVDICHAAGQPPANDPVAPPPLLVVDDSLTTRMLEQGILESAGYEVELAVSGEDGLARARARPHALFLVDVEMPGINGFEFIEQIRSDAALRDTPALLVTSLGSAAHRERGARSGADGYINKGQFEQKEFLAMVRRLVQRR